MTRRVRLAEVDIEQFHRLEKHQEAMLREFTLISLGAQTGVAAAPQQLVSRVERLRERFAGQREAIFAQVGEAARAGARTVALELDLPEGAAQDLLDALRAYEEADAYCRSGDLLTLACPPDVAALRRQLYLDIIDQLTR
jgi:hypothetical protein